MDKPTANLIQIMRDRVKSLREQGDLKEALHAANAAVDKCQQLLSPDHDTIDAFVASLEDRAGIHMDMREFGDATEDAKHAIDQLDGRKDKFDQMGRMYALLGGAYDGLDRYDRVISSWEKAVDYFEMTDPPMMMDVAAITNNLGFTAKSAGNLDAAEDYFLKALEIMHSVIGAKHPETASVSNNLGAVYLAAGYLEQAREMHMMALETRMELFGDHHPDTAQSHNNLALALLATGDRDWARKHFEKALEGFETLGREYDEDLEAVASNFCDFLRAQKDDKLADIIDARVKARVSKH
ncbi:MAG: tetratricopeptide repeat protein [Verrucomicrobiota bacterium]